MFTTNQISEIVGKSSGAIRLMVSRGHWMPEKPGTGRGSDHEWSLADAVNVALFFRMVKSGINQDTVGRILNGASRNIGRWGLSQAKRPAAAVLVVFRYPDGKFDTVRPVSKGIEQLSTTSGWIEARCFDLLHIVDHVRLAIDYLKE